MSAHRIKAVEEGSQAWELGIEPGMELVSVDGREVEDVFDYRMLMSGEDISVVIREENGDETELLIDLEPGEDFGISFESGLMDEYRSCRNHCIFCFIDQMPPGMRETLYFKDDDARLSFLQGNYVTLTNMSDHDIDRIIRYHMEPVNISVHTTNPSLRVKMLRNSSAGDIFGKMKNLRDAGIRMNGQIVLCKGWNDREELDRTIGDLTEYLPAMESVSVVPIGLTRFRRGLAHVEPFTKEDAGVVIDQIERWQRRIWDTLAESYIPEEGEVEPDLTRGAPRHFIHASDEWYLLAGRELPEEGRYDGYLQYENGVGMLRLLMTESAQAIEELKNHFGEHSCERHVLSATGALAAPFIRKIAESVTDTFPGYTVDVLTIENCFFGESITVSGLITGRDLIAQVKEHLKSASAKTPEELLIPVNMLRSGEEVFLDDIIVADVVRETGLPVRIIRENGENLVRGILGLPEAADKDRQYYESARSEGSSSGNSDI